MAYIYTYNITDFPEQKVSIPRLTAEISDSSISSSSVEFINSYPTTVDINFVAQLSPVDVSTLNIIVANHNAEGSLPAEPYTFGFDIKEKGDENDITFGCPIPTALPSIAKAYGPLQIQVLGNKGPNFSNISDFGITWDLNAQSFPTFNLSTTDGIPAWYLNLLPLTTQTFGSPYPSLSISDTSIANFDGDYWANVISPGSFVLYSKTGNFTLLFKDTSTSYITPQYNANFAIIDSSNNLFASNIPAHLEGTHFNYAESVTESTTTSTTYQTKLTLSVNNLPNGLYRIGVYYIWSGSSATYNFLSRVLLNSVALGDEHINRIANVANYIPHYRTFYKVLAGNNTIQLQYRTSNAAGTSRIKNCIIELWRIA